MTGSTVLSRWPASCSPPLPESRDCTEDRMWDNNPEFGVFVSLLRMATGYDLIDVCGQSFEGVWATCKGASGLPKPHLQRGDESAQDAECHVCNTFCLTVLPLAVNQDLRSQRSSTHE